MTRISQLKRASSFSFALALVGFCVVSLSLSIWLTKDTSWVQWHLSRLGEGPELSAAVFNMSLMIAALILAMFGIRVTDEIRQRYPNESIVISKMLFIGIAIAWAGVGGFPFDRFPLTHNFFGYLQTLLVSIIMLRLKHLHKGFSQRTHAIGLMAVILTIGLLILHHLVHTPTLVVVELTGQIFIFVWLISMTFDLRSR